MVSTNVLMCISAIVWLVLLALAGLVVYEVRKAGTRRSEKIAAGPQPPHVPVWVDLARCEIHTDGTITTPDYWYCECSGGTYWPRDLTTCPRCLGRSDGCADADLYYIAKRVGSRI